MSASTITQIVFLIIMTICAVVSLLAGFIGGRNVDKKTKQATMSRKVIRIRMACFLIMLVCLFICVVI